MDDLVLQYKALDKINVVPQQIAKKLPPLPSHVKDNVVKYNTPCPKGKPRVKQPPPARLPLNHHNFTRSKPYTFDAPQKVG